MKEKLKEFGETNDEQVRFMKERIEYMKTSKTGKLSDADENKLEEVLKVVEETNPAQKNVIDFNVTRKICQPCHKVCICVDNCAPYFLIDERYRRQR